MTSRGMHVLLRAGMCGVLLLLAPLFFTALDAGAQPGAPLAIDGPHVEPPAVPTTVHPAELMRGGEHPRPVKPFRHPWGQAALDSQKAAAELQGPGPGIQTMTLLGSLQPSLGTGFDGITSAESFCNCYPPDGAIAVSPSYVVAAVNTAFKVWTKTGALSVGPTSLNNLFANNTSCLANVSDPFAGYDAATSEFVLGALTYDSKYNSSICIAVTTDPTGSWTVYGFPVTPSNDLLDFPRMAIGSDAIYVTGNQFQNGTSFTGARVAAYDKTAMYNGVGATSVYFNVGNNAAGNLADSLTPAQAVTVSNTAYLIAADNCNGCSTISLWRMITPPATGTSPFGAGSTFTLQGGVRVTAYSQPPNAKQPNGGRITTNDTRNLGASWSNSTVYGTHAIGCNPGSGAVACVQWYQLDNLSVTPSLVQQGIASSKGGYRYYPNLAVDVKGNLGIAYAYSSSTTYAGIRYTGRLASDTPGTLEAEAVMEAGQAPINGGRYGDYAGTVLDPNSCTIWHVEEYAKAGYLWGTWVGSFTFPGC